jgi:endonuclease III
LDVVVRDDIIRDITDEVQGSVGVLETKEKKKRKAKNTHPYGLTPGLSPFPYHTKPTPEDCIEVNRLLTLAHGEKARPKVIPPPSAHVTGCGEVPDLLDALLRTLLSAATSSSNANKSMAGLQARFGLSNKGSANWSAIRKATRVEVMAAIKSGGLAEVKSGYIKNLLDTVYNRNYSRREQLIQERSILDADDIAGRQQKDIQVSQLGDDLLSMDYVFEMSTDDAMLEMTKLPGIGVKTASCVILFCMQRPSFAVDTHVWRFCKWLDWVPDEKSTTRDKTFSHCEVRVPDDLKYSLHWLFIQHGKKCGRCRANTSAGTEEWNNTVCPIEHLVSRSGVRKSGGGGKVKKAMAKALSGAKKRKLDEYEDSDDGDEDYGA